ncbi:polysaccharide deacetylase family protein [Sphingobacterium thalpophilum]|uniref:Polysaccharide deacetylase family protein n=2 Tax=Sphingobacterium thalpophilum TaxID=259 RepID=A0ABV4HEI0_9SPHI|nr:polysaccharide deacetylase family protein [Sphingobacterium thalpophilum]
MKSRRLMAASLAFAVVLGSVGCKDFSSKVLGSDREISNDTLNTKLIDKARVPVLLNKWDSLQKNQIHFTVDSLRPVSIKQQKRSLKDSLRRAFDAHPKHIYLTFDDGPLIGSAAIDSIAKEKNVKVSVFLIGKHANMSKGRKRDLAKYESNPLIACYNHSYTHANNQYSRFYNNPQKAFADFEKNEKDLNLKHKIVRLPGRNIWMYGDVRKIDLKNGASTADILHKNGYSIYGWDVEWRLNSVTGNPIQSQEVTVKEIRHFMNNKSSMVPNNVVFLMHDDMFQTKKGQQQLSSLIDILKSEGYQFEFMQDYPIKY